MAPKKRPVRDRIAERTDRSGGPDSCWPYRGAPGNEEGHRQIWLDGKNQSVHRVVWELENGPIPDGLLVRHSCDNPPCVNPRHLLLGTVADNMHDRDQRGRQGNLRGEKHGSAKLKDSDVLQIRALAKEGVLQRDIAEKFGVDSSLVSMIVARKIWKSV